MRLVVQITDKGPGSGGIRRVVEDHAEMLSDLGWKVRRLLLTGKKVDHLDPTETIAPIAFAQGPRAEADAISALRKIGQSADLIHLHLGLTAVTPALLRQAAAIAPLVVSLHDISPFEPQSDECPPDNIITRLARWRHGPARRAVWQAVCTQARVIHTPSSYLTDLARRAGAPTERLMVLPHMVPTPETQPRPLADCAPLVVYAGLLSRPKGAHLLLPALRAMQDRDTRLIICGDGPLADTIARDVAQSGLGDRVTLTGRIDRPEVLHWMGKARAIVHPSLIPEGFGLTMLEAMLLGRPVVGFGAGATGEWLTDGVTGLVARPATAEALAEALLRLVNDPSLGAQLGQAGSTQALALCAPSVVRAGLATLYDAALAQSTVGV